jgi:hypothetical protein
MPVRAAPLARRRRSAGAAPAAGHAMRDGRYSKIGYV